MIKQKYMHPSRVLRWGAGGVIAGIALLTFFPSWWSLDFLVPTSILGGALFLLCVMRARRRRLLCIVVMGFAIGSARFLVALPAELPRHVEGEGILENVTQQRYGGFTIVVSREERTRLRIADVHGTFAYGDRLRISCTPEPIERDGGFDFRAAAQGIFFGCTGARITLLGHDAGNPLMQTLLGFRAGMERVMLQHVAEPSAGLLRGILLGVDADLSDTITRAFTRTGLVHLLVVSGMHMVLFADLLASLLAVCGLYPRSRAVATVIFLVAFLAMIGFPASALRGFWFALVTIIAALIGRTRSIGNAILGVAAAMVLWNPYLIRDIGFLLSFLATIGITVGRQRIEIAWESFHGAITGWRGIPLFPKPRPHDTWLRRVVLGPLHQFFRSTLFETLGAALLTAPLVATVFGQFSLIAPLANLLIVGWVAPFMALGLVFLVVGWIPVVGLVLVPMIVGLGRLIITVVEFLARLPFASVIVSRSGLITLCIYCLIALWIFRSSRAPAQSSSVG